MTCRISVQVVPRSSKIAIVVQGKNSYKVKLTSPPVDGAANEQLIKVLAGKLSVSKGSIEIISGEHGRRKVVQISGLDEAEAGRRLVAQNKT